MTDEISDETLAERLAELEQRERALDARLNSSAKVLPLIATVAALAPDAMSALVPPPKRFDCPKCHRSKLQRSSTMAYCLRCSYVEKTR